MRKSRRIAERGHAAAVAPLVERLRERSTPDPVELLVQFVAPGGEVVEEQVVQFQTVAPRRR